jgi:hypothetical protein
LGLVASDSLPAPFLVATLLRTWLAFVFGWALGRDLDAADEWPADEAEL